MASHLTIISGTGGASASARVFTGQQANAQNATTEPGDLLGLFAALLGNATSVPTTAPVLPGGLAANGDAATQALTDLDLAGLFKLGLESGFGDASEDDTTDAEAMAAALDLSTQVAVPAEPKPIIDFVEALSALKASLDKGEPLDPDLLKDVEAALAGLAEALGLEIDTLDIPEDFAALLETTGADETGLAGALTQLLAPMAQSLATAQPATGAEQAADAVTASAQLKALGDKLGALLAALEDGQVSAEKLAALGMTPGQPLDAEIEAALIRFAAGLTGAPVIVPEEPVLATPVLKLTEPVLSGKPAETTEPSQAAERTPAPPVASAGSEKSAGQGGTDNQSTADGGRNRYDTAPREPRANTGPAAPPPTDASGNPSPSADASVQQAATARVDAAANPRIIQAGYQTSQQQLNLPQIAFELARQVQDGNTRFQIRLDPPELGRIDVRLDIDQSGQVNARLTVEKSETLDLMQRDQRGLERALQQAGLDSSKTNLEFSLKQNPFAGQQGNMGEGKGQDGSEAGLSANDNGQGTGGEESPPMVNLYRGGLQASGVNIIA
ncbi:flagellar hook-length control protein FliK [Devosia sp. CAU 1758]